jgi:hypothetical protein
VLFTIVAATVFLAIVLVTAAVTLDNGERDEGQYQIVVNTVQRSTR